MLKNYPSTYLFLVSLVAFVVIAFSTPIVGSWHIYCSIIMEVLTFIMRVVVVFFLCCAAIEMTHGLLLRNRHH